MVELHDDTFATHTTTGTTVIDFWAEWCGPCKTLTPVYAEVAGALAHRALFAKLNVDLAPQSARAHNVQSIPTILVVRDGTEVGRIVGARSANQLTRELELLLA